MEVIVGRERELIRVDRLLAAAREGRAGSVVLVGEPGIGKTALLEAAAERGGVNVLRTRGVESELELPYMALLELLRPLVDQVDALPAPQSEALRAALALAPRERGADRLAVAAATMGLLIAAGEGGPLLVLVDDAQWLDVPTRETLAVAARRLGDASVAILWSARPGLDLEGLEVLELGPLPRGAAAELARRGAPGLEPDAEARVLDLAAGNPLALLELPHLLAERASGPGPVDEPPPSGEAGERLFGPRFRALSDGARLALTASAAARTGALRVLRPAWLELGVDESAIEEAEASGLISLNASSLVFRHPLVRSLAYESAAAPVRRRSHSALAIALSAEPGDESTWHRALAAVGPDEGVAAALEEVARRAPTRAAAADALLRSARLTSSVEARPRRLLEAGWAARETGRPALASDLAGEALVAAPDVIQRARAHHLLALLEDRGSLALERLLDAAEEVVVVAPAESARMLVDAVDLCIGLGMAERGLELARRAASLTAHAEPELRLRLSLRHVDATLFTGRPVDAERLSRDAARIIEPDLPPGEPLTSILFAETLLTGMQLARARTVCNAAVAAARTSGSLQTLRSGLAILFSIEWTAGEVAAARIAAEEELELATALGRAADRIEPLGHYAWVAAAQGREEDCRAAVRDRYVLAERFRPDPLLHAALGLLELGLGSAQSAVAALERTTATRAARGVLSAALPSPEVPLLVEAYARAGRLEDATRTLWSYEEDAERTGWPFACALGWRCRGLLDEDYDTAFTRALADHDRDRAFERARTVLLYGERLRRAKRRVDAREQLREAVVTFERLGAELWRRRAEAELAATGERPRRREPTTAGELTPQEVLVARLVASGLTNRAVASQLFVTTNTVETHLRHIFQKLGVRSRTELAHRFPAEAHANHERILAHDTDG